MSLLNKSYMKLSLLFVFIWVAVTGNVFASDYIVTGKVTDINGGIVPGARISMTAGTTEYVAISGNDG